MYTYTNVYMYKCIYVYIQMCGSLHRLHCLCFPPQEVWLGSQQPSTKDSPNCLLQGENKRITQHSASWVCSRFTFSLLRSAIQCICGACFSTGHAIKSISSVDIANAKTQLRLVNWLYPVPFACVHLLMYYICITLPLWYIYGIMEFKKISRCLTDTSHDADVFLT